MLLRSLGVIAFISLAGAAGIYFAQRPTIASGEVVAADLIKSNGAVKSLDCDKEIPIRHAGATFGCNVELKTGQRGRLRFIIDRAGSITSVEEEAPEPVRIEKTGDPWAD